MRSVVPKKIRSAVSEFRFCLLILTVLALSCQKKEDHKKNPANNGTAVTTTASSQPLPTARQKALIEIYTGHKCGTFPSLAEIAAAHSFKYQDSIVYLVIHAGFFSSADQKFPITFTTTAGNEWHEYFLQSKVYPSALLNRNMEPLPGAQHWPTPIDSLFLTEQMLSLSVSPDYEETTRKLNVNIRGLFKKDYGGSVDITVILSEDSLVAPQLDYRKSENYVPGYVHFNMMRGSLNGSWGSALTNSSVKANQLVSLSISGDIDGKISTNHLYVVAIATDKNTRDVLQVEKVRVIQ